MLEAKVHQQVQSGVPTELGQVLIQQSVALACAAQIAFPISLFQSPIKEFDPLFSDNSMFLTDMEFFIPSVSALMNVSKRDQ